jgi:hypothetical protein
MCVIHRHPFHFWVRKDVRESIPNINHRFNSNIQPTQQHEIEALLSIT